MTCTRRTVLLYSQLFTHHSQRSLTVGRHGWRATSCMMCIFPAALNSTVSPSLLWRLKTANTNGTINISAPWLDGALSVSPRECHWNVTYHAYPAEVHEFFIWAEFEHNIGWVNLAVFSVKAVTAGVHIYTHGVHCIALKSVCLVKSAWSTCH